MRNNITYGTLPEGMIDFSLLLSQQQRKRPNNPLRPLRLEQSPAKRDASTGGKKRKIT
jgi:hypothetical protein